MSIVAPLMPAVVVALNTRPCSLPSPIAVAENVTGGVEDPGNAACIVWTASSDPRVQVVCARPSVFVTTETGLTEPLLGTENSTRVPLTGAPVVGELTFTTSGAANTESVRPD